jgi:hypothetical protein
MMPTYGLALAVSSSSLFAKSDEHGPAKAKPIKGNGPAANDNNGTTNWVAACIFYLAAGRLSRNGNSNKQFQQTPLFFVGHSLLHGYCF